MKNTLILMINKYAILAFAVVAFGLRFLFQHDITQHSFSLPGAIKTFFIIIYTGAILNILSFIAVTLVTRSKSKNWWESFDDQTKQLKKEKLLQIYIQSLIVSFLIVAYGAIVYLAIFETWKIIFIVIVIVINGNLITRFRTQRR